jgi:ATP-dependent RNA helicase DDX19/DBP5
VCSIISRVVVAMGDIKVDDAVHEWSEFSIPRHEEFAKGFAALEWIRPLPVQVQTLPLIFQSPAKNVIAQAPTGKGKTGAFAIGMLGRSDPGEEAPQAICLAPTREIAVQTADRTLKVLADFHGLKVFKAIRDAEAPGPIKEQIVVGTAGTVIKLIKEGKLALNKVKVLVIDEADTMVQKDIEKRENSRDTGKKKDMTRTVMDIKK